jgi:hypothetical protein
MYYDVFISHASEDKAHVARPLAHNLQRLGLRVWLDEFELTLGDSLRRSIDRGLRESRYGVVILSPAFFRKEWPNKEIDGLVSREDGREKVILPVWHNVTKDDVVKYSPILADKIAVSTSYGLDHVATQIFHAVSHASSIVSSELADEQIPLRFTTNTLDNDEFLFSAAPWPFLTDPKGEDIKSKHTAKSKRDGIIPHRAFTSAYPTVAVNELIIEFHLRNLTTEARYLEMLYLKVEGTYPVRETMYWNTWKPILEPHNFRLLLNRTQEFYEVDFMGRIIEVLANGVEHFRLAVHGEATCAGLIFEFRLGAISHDAAGNKYQTLSDRIYHLAFLRENLTTTELKNDYEYR